MTRPLPPEPDFERLGQRFSAMVNEIVQAPERAWRTDVDLYAGVLRQLLERGNSGFISCRESMNTLNANAVVDRLNMEAARRQAREARIEADRVKAEAAEDLASALMDWCNEHTVPSRYRREGVVLAVQMLRQIALRLAVRAENRRPTEEI